MKTIISKKQADKLRELRMKETKISEILIQKVNDEIKVQIRKEKTPIVIRRAIAFSDLQWGALKVKLVSLGWTLRETVSHDEGHFLTLL